jgi:exodeoxyribonuclease VII large subunit
VARAIDKSVLPVISAVGHEIDYSISDFVADRRAPTPSAAAEMVVRDRQELLGIIAYFQEKFSTILLQKIGNFGEHLQSLKISYGLRRPEDLLYQKMQRVDDITKNIQIGFHHHLDMKKQSLDNVLKRLQALSPLEVLGRGYSICYKDGEIVKDVAQLKIEDLVQVKLLHGKFLSQIQKLEQ